MDKTAKIYVAGHRGMVGSAILRELKRQGYNNIIIRTRRELDLQRQDLVEKFFSEEKPEYVFLAAAKVGGIVANQSALADFMYDNVMLEMNVAQKDFNRLVKGLPSMKSPTIAPLFGNNGFAVKIAVQKSEVPTLLPQLKSLGATDILEYELRKVMP